MSDLTCLEVSETLSAPGIRACLAPGLGSSVTVVLSSIFPLSNVLSTLAPRRSKDGNEPPLHFALELQQGKHGTQDMSARARFLAHKHRTYFEPPGLHGAGVALNFL